MASLLLLSVPLTWHTLVASLTLLCFLMALYSSPVVSVAQWSSQTPMASCRLSSSTPQPSRGRLLPRRQYRAITTRSASFCQTAVSLVEGVVSATSAKLAAVPLIATSLLITPMVRLSRHLISLTPMVLLQPVLQSQT